MKRTLSAILLMALISGSAKGQCSDTLIGGGGRGYDRTYSAKFDRDENIYTIGFYDSSATFSGIVLNTAISKRAGVFLLKYAPNRQLLFAKTLAQYKSPQSLQPGIAISDNGIYACMSVTSPQFDIGSVGYNDSANAFHFLSIIRTDLSGNIKWQRTMHFRNMGAVPNWPTIAVDKAGNAYLANTFSDTMRVGNYLLGTAGRYLTTLIMKIDSNGNVLWAHDFSSQNAGYTFQNHIHVSERGQVVIGGIYNTNVAYGGVVSGHTDTTFAARAGFLIAFDTSGNFKWLQTSVSNKPNAECTPLGSAGDAAGNSYVTGGFRDSVNFGGGYQLYGYGGGERYLAKYSADGTLLWVKKNLKHVTMPNEAGEGIVVNHAGNIVATNLFFDSTYYGNQKFVSAGSGDIAIAEYDTSGSLLRVDVIGSSGLDDAQSLMVHANDSLAIAGAFWAPTLSINGHTITNYSPNGLSDMFIYDRCVAWPLIVRAASNPVQEVLVYPNPTNAVVNISLDGAIAQPRSIAVFDTYGRQLIRQTLAPHNTTARVDLAPYPPGAYLIVVEDGTSKYKRLILKER